MDARQNPPAFFGYPATVWFHNCLNFRSALHNVTNRQRSAFVMICMPEGSRYEHCQSGGYVCMNYLLLEDSAVLGVDYFPLFGFSG